MNDVLMTHETLRKQQGSIGVRRWILPASSVRKRPG
jgi:hypothetical protein